MYNYETVSVYAKDPQDAKNAMDKAIAERPHAKLAHVTPFTKPNGWYSAAETVALILTCLLYTSPSPRDATLSRMPSSA